MAFISRVEAAADRCPSVHRGLRVMRYGDGGRPKMFGTDYRHDPGPETLVTAWGLRPAVTWSQCLEEALWFVDKSKGSLSSSQGPPLAPLFQVSG